jgi:hypothetical protein
MLYKKYFCFILCAITIQTVAADESLNLTTNGLIDDLTQETFLTGEDPDSIKGIKRTASYRGQHKFNSPIVVHETLFIPADTPRKQINVQIIDPESHNNGQFLKETTYLKEENSTIVSSTTTKTTTTAAPALTTDIGATTGSTTTTSTQRPYTTSYTQKSLSAKFLAPIQAGLRLSSEPKQKLDEDCDEDLPSSTTTTIGPPRKAEQRTVVNVHKNVRVNKVLVQPGPYGAHKLVGIPTKQPCTQPNKCGEDNGYLPPAPVVPIIPVKPTIVHTQRPVIIHTTERVPIEVEKLVVKEVPIDRPVPYPVDRVIERIVEKPVEKVVIKEVPYDRIVEKVVNVDRPVPYPVNRLIPVEKPVERVVVKDVPYPVIQEKIVHVDRPVIQEKIVEIDRPVIQEKVVEIEKQVPVDRPIHVPVHIDRPIPVEVGVPVYHLVHVEVPIPIHHLVEKNVPYPVHVHIPYLLKPPPKPHYIIKTNKVKEHGLFDFKHNHHHKTIKHIYLKEPNNIIGDTIIDSHHAPHPYPFDTFGLLPPPLSFQTIDAIPSPFTHNLHIDREPRFQSIDSYGPQAAASINVINTALPPASFNSYNSHHFHSHKNNHVAHQLQRPNFSGGLNLKELRWEYGFKPPLIPSTEIDDFGNPIKKNLT